MQPQSRWAACGVLLGLLASSACKPHVEFESTRATDSEVESIGTSEIPRSDANDAATTPDDGDTDSNASPGCNAPVCTPIGPAPSVVVPRQTLTADGAKLSIDDGQHKGFSVTFPQGAVTGTFSAEATTVVEGAPLSGGVSAVYKLTPEGVPFAKPVMVVIPTTSNDPSIELWTRKDAEHPWQRVKDQVFLREARLVVGWVEHFSQFGAAVQGSSTETKPQRDCMCIGEFGQILCLEPLVVSAGEVSCNKQWERAQEGGSCSGHESEFLLEKWLSEACKDKDASCWRRATQGVGTYAICANGPDDAYQSPFAPCSGTSTFDGEEVPEGELLPPDEASTAAAEPWTIDQAREAIDAWAANHVSLPDPDNPHFSGKGFARLITDWANAQPGAPLDGYATDEALQLFKRTTMDEIRADLSARPVGSKFTRPQAEVLHRLSTGQLRVNLIPPSEQSDGSRVVSNAGRQEPAIFFRGAKGRRAGRTPLETLLHEGGHALAQSGKMANVHAGNGVHSVIYREIVADLVAYGGSYEAAFVHTSHQESYGRLFSKLYETFPGLAAKSKVEQFRVLRYLSENYRGVNDSRWDSILLLRDLQKQRPIIDEALNPRCE